MRPIYKRALTQIGERLANYRRFMAIMKYLSVGAWMHQHGFSDAPRVTRRERVWDRVLQDVCNERVLYLEFGVWQGEATRYWSKALKHPESVLHGFDSFEGLPESAGVWNKGDFAVAGAIPTVDDSRVRFHKGWFDAVLPTYTVPPHDRLVLNMDADLYSSTVYVLRHMRPWIKAGTYVYFDELHHLEHEARALDEFMRETGLRFDVVAADSALSGVCFRCVG
jgi:hypothetical protein